MVIIYKINLLLFCIEKIADRFNFESRLKCKLEFLNFTELIYKEVSKLTNESDFKRFSFLPRNEYNRKKVVRKFINEYLENFCKVELKNSKVSHHKNVLWKWSNENGENDDGRFSSVFFTDSRRDSLVDEPFSYIQTVTMETRNSLKYHNELKPLNSNQTFHKGNSFGNFSNIEINYKSNIKFDNKYAQDFYNTKNIDYVKLINKYSGSFFSTREFKGLDLPDTKNFKKLSRENSLVHGDTIQPFTVDNRSNSFLQDDDSNYYWIKSRYRHIKKKLPYFLFIFILIVVILITISSS